MSDHAESDHAHKTNDTEMTAEEAEDILGLKIIFFSSPIVIFMFAVALYGTQGRRYLHLLYRWAVATGISLLVSLFSRSRKIKLLTKAALLGCLLVCFCVIAILTCGAYAMTGRGDEPLSV